MKKNILLILLVGIRIFVFAQCDPGNHSGKLGCPDPFGSCGGQDGLKFNIPIIRSSDPNEIIGPKGFGVNQWVSAKAIMPYKILFENDPDFATAPAQRVIIYLPIPQHINPNSVRIGDFGFGSFNFTVPPNTTAYYKRLNVKDSLGVYVDLTAGLDQVNHRAFWLFESIDTLSGLASTLPVGAGFLPVNDSLIHNGEGYVNLTMQPYSSALSFDTVLAKASIIFDANDTISTNTAVNIIDATEPQSHLNALAAMSGNLINLQWSGTDAESGLERYSIYYSSNNGPFVPLLTDTAITSIQFYGQNNTDYAFYSVAKDSAGNTEEPPHVADAATHVGAHSLTLNLKVFIQGFYFAFETMQPVLLNQGVGADTAVTDSILVELRQANFPFSVVTSNVAILHTDGRSTVYFDSVAYGDYYLVVKNRSAVQTWSAQPLHIQSPQKSYDFTISAAAAYGGNQISVEPGVFAIFSGDFNQDENVDLFDMIMEEMAISLFSFGYYPMDINGDGNVDLLDAQLLEQNISDFIFSHHP